MGEEAVPSPQVPLSESQVVVSVPAPSVSPALSFPQREPQVKSRPKATYTDKAADISMTQGFLPEDKDSLHNMGIPAAYAIRHSGTSGKGRSLYMCPFGDQCSSPPYVSDIASTGSHVRHHHLGHCIHCPYDGSRFYNGTGWRDHMSSKHEGALGTILSLGLIASFPLPSSRLPLLQQPLVQLFRPLAIMPVLSLPILQKQLFQPQFCWPWMCLRLTLWSISPTLKMSPLMSPTLNQNPPLPNKVLTLNL